jgi:hypothetical protein
MHRQSDSRSPLDDTLLDPPRRHPSMPFQFLPIFDPAETAQGVLPFPATGNYQSR